MRCISPMEYQSTALSVHWYQSYHWYQWTTGIPPYSYMIHCKNTLSPLSEMHFTNGIPIDCLVSPLVPIVPIVPLLPMDDWNPPYSSLIHCENILSPFNEMHFTNGIPIDCLLSPLVPIVPLVPMDDRNLPVLLHDSLQKHSKSP